MSETKGKKKSIRVSDCCYAPFTTEIWVSKIIRRIRICRLCGNPCRAIKRQQAAIPWIP